MICNYRRLIELAGESIGRLARELKKRRTRNAALLAAVEASEEGAGGGEGAGSGGWVLGVSP